jgi:hypothetical protein
MRIFHATAVLDGSNVSSTDSIGTARLANLANPAGGSAGAAVVVAVAAKGLPPVYAVNVTPGQDATAFVSAKTPNGFNVTLTPRLAATTLAAGIFDVTVQF